MIIDTMIFAYALLKVEGKCEESILILEQANRIVVPDSLRAELANAIWQWVKYRNVSEAVAYEVLQDAEALIEQVVNSKQVWTRALQLAIEADHPVYNTLFVAAAEALEDRVVTYDEKMQAKFPDWVLSPQAFFASLQR